MDPPHRRRSGRHGARRDLLVIFGVTGLIAMLALVTGTPRRLEAWLDGHEIRVIGELAVLAWLLALGLTIFAYRRWSDLRLDVQAREEAERDLEESRRLFERIARASPDVIYVFDLAEQRLVYANRQLAEILGYSLEDAGAMGERFLPTIMHPDDLQDLNLTSADWDATGDGEIHEAEYRVRRSDGAWRWLYVRDGVFRRDPEGRVVQIVGTAQDVTDRHTADEALRAAEARFRDLVERTPAITYQERVGDLADAGMMIYVSPHVEPLLGYTPEEFARRGLWLEVIHPKDRDRVIRQGQRTIRERERFSMEYRMRARDGRMVWFRDESIIVEEAQDGSQLWQGVMLDITERKRAEEALREAEDRYRTLVEQLPVVVYINTPDPTLASSYHVVYVSPKVEDVLGYTAEEWLEDPDLWFKMLHPEDADRANDANARASETGDPFRLEYRVIRPDGRVIWLHEEATLLAAAGDRPNYWQGVMVDITARKEHEQLRRELSSRLVQAQEDERRRISAEIHDDPVQKMTAVGLRLAAMQRRSEGTELAHGFDPLMDSVQTAISRLRHLMFELQPPILDREGLAAAIRQYAREAGLEGGFELSLEDRLVQEPPLEIRTIAYRIAQEAIANVRKHASAKLLEVQLAPREGGIVVRVRDDGRGFAADQPPEPGHLGVSTMRERAELAGGGLRLESRPGSGTLVEFWLPETDASRASAPREMASRLPS